MGTRPWTGRRRSSWQWKAGAWCSSWARPAPGSAPRSESSWTSGIMIRHVLERNGGYLAMVGTDSNSYQHLGKARIQVMKAASPALSNGYIFLRKKDKVACYDLRAK